MLVAGGRRQVHVRKRFSTSAELRRSWPGAQRPPHVRIARTRMRSGHRFGRADRHHQGSRTALAVWAEGFEVFEQAVRRDLALRPHDMRTRPDRNARFQDAVVALTEFGKAKILDRPETVLAKHLGQVPWIEQAKPRLASRGSTLGDSDDVGAAIGGITFKRLGIVEHDLRPRNVGDKIQRGRNRLRRTQAGQHENLIAPILRRCLAARSQRARR